MTPTNENSLRGYVAGFIFSIILTLEAFFLVNQQSLNGWNLIFVLLALAVTQLGVQLFFFLDIGKEKGPRWNLAALIFTLGVILIIVFGSLWIIKSLSYNHERLLTPQQEEQQIIDDELVKP